MKKILKSISLLTVTCMLFSCIMSFPVSAGTQPENTGDDIAEVKELYSSLNDRPLTIEKDDAEWFYIFGYDDGGNYGLGKTPFELLIADESVACIVGVNGCMTAVEGISAGSTVLKVKAPDGRELDIDIEVCDSEHEYIPHPDYAPGMDYDPSPMETGETREIRVYNPGTGKTGKLTIKVSQTENCSVEYEEGSDRFYITALQEGHISICVAESTCPFQGYIEMDAYEPQPLPDYAPKLMYDSSPMILNEIRGIRVFNPETGKTGDLSVYISDPDVCELIHSESKDTVYISACGTGKCRIEITESTCAFPGHITIEVVDDRNTDEENSEHTQPTVDINYNKPGDLNGDGAVNVADLVRLQQLLNNKAPYTSAADMNRDGTVNVFDMVLLRRLILNS